FPACTDAQKQTIRDIADRLDAHRKRQQQLHPSLTLTEMYNVLEKLRASDSPPQMPVILSEGRNATAVEGPRGPSSATASGTFLLTNPPAFTEQDHHIYDAGLIGSLRELHDALDRAVFDAYGWPHTLTTEQVLEHVVALNAERRDEEASGL